jgi:hypothetical protein
MIYPTSSNATYFIRGGDWEVHRLDDYSGRFLIPTPALVPPTSFEPLGGEERTWRMGRTSRSASASLSGRKGRDIYSNPTSPLNAVGVGHPMRERDEQAERAIASPAAVGTASWVDA